MKDMIEGMRKTKLKDNNSTVGQIAKEKANEKWCKSPAEVLINTILAMRQKWDETAKPRLESFKKNYSHVKTVYDLKSLMDSMSEIDFCHKILGMKIKQTPNWRYQMLRNMVIAFGNYQREKGFRTDHEAIMDWAPAYWNALVSPINPSPPISFPRAVWQAESVSKSASILICSKISHAWRSPFSSSTLG